MRHSDWRAIWWAKGAEDFISGRFKRFSCGGVKTVPQKRFNVIKRLLFQDQQSVVFYGLIETIHIQNLGFVDVRSSWTAESWTTWWPVLNFFVATMPGFMFVPCLFYVCSMVPLFWGSVHLNLDLFQVIFSHQKLGEYFFQVPIKQINLTPLPPASIPLHGRGKPRGGAPWRQRGPEPWICLSIDSSFENASAKGGMTFGIRNSRTPDMKKGLLLIRRSWMLNISWCVDVTTNGANILYKYIYIYIHGCKMMQGCQIFPTGHEQKPNLDSECMSPHDTRQDALRLPVVFPQNWTNSESWLMKAAQPYVVTVSFFQREIRQPNRPAFVSTTTGFGKGFCFCFSHWFLPGIIIWKTNIALKKHGFNRKIVSGFSSAMLVYHTVKDYDKKVPLVFRSTAKTCLMPFCFGDDYSYLTTATFVKWFQSANQVHIYCVMTMGNPQWRSNRPNGLNFIVFVGKLLPFVATCLISRTLGCSFGYLRISICCVNILAVWRRFFFFNFHGFWRMWGNFFWEAPGRNGFELKQWLLIPPVIGVATGSVHLKAYFELFEKTGGSR